MADYSGATSSHSPGSTSANGGGRGAHGLIDKVRDTAAAQLTSQKNRATDGLGSISQAVRQSTNQLRDQEHDVIAHYVEQAADQIDRFSQRMRDKDIGDLMNDIQRMARRQPALFIGGAFAVGLIGARFLKSSNRTEHSNASAYPSDADRSRRMVHEAGMTTPTTDGGLADASPRPTASSTASSRRPTAQTERP
jgi:hypothetical protein